MGRPAHFLGILAAALGLAAACLAPIAWLRFGASGLEALGWITAACLLPGVVLAVAARWVTGSQQPLVLLMLGTALRVGMVLLVSLMVIQLRPDLKTKEFFVGLAVLYCVALAVETRQLLQCAASTRQLLQCAASTRQQQQHAASTRRVAEVGPSSPRQPQSI